MDNNSDKIKLYDANGREYTMSRQDWASKILPGKFKEACYSPDKLHTFLYSCLQDGFFIEVIPYAEHFFQIDNGSIRAATILGIIYLKVGRLDDAQKVFENCNKLHGESGVILVNLAKVYATHGDNNRAEQILWHGLEIDPNQKNGLDWYAAIQRERGGDQGYLDAFRRVASLPRSWFAQLALARDALQHKDIEAAKKLYAIAFERAGRPIPSDLLLSISGELGKNGYEADAVKLVQPLFNPKIHDILVGYNLMAAYYSLKRKRDAERILRQLYALNRHDWQKTLDSWRDKIATL
jgi:tetratricopeptide (TPR) repeat protein